MSTLCPTFLIMSLSSFNSKGFYYSLAWSCSLCERRSSFCLRLISRKLCRFLLMFPTGFTSLSVFLLFPLSITFSVFYKVFGSISFIIDEVLSINPSANVFVFGDLNIHNMDWQTYSGGTVRPGEVLQFFHLKWPYSDLGVF